jgi:hypothetical protein
MHVDTVVAATGYRPRFSSRWFFRRPTRIRPSGRVVRTAQELRPWPIPALSRLLAHVAKSKDIPDEHKQILLTDIKGNRARDAGRASAAYLDYIGANSEPAERLVASGIPRMGGTRRERATADSPSQSTRLSMPPRS